jgi:hypothetical protein
VGAVWGDYDNDGRPDLYVTSTRGGNVLFHNNGDGTFTDVTEKAGVGLTAHSQSAVFFDYDNDGHADLLVLNTAGWTLDRPRGKGHFPGRASIFELADSPIESHVLYRNNGDGTFTDVTEKAGLAGRGWGGDAAVFDFDGDGWLDIFISTMFGQSQLFRNNGDGTFTDVTRSVLPRSSFGAIGCRAFDFDNDGRLDLLITDMHSDMWWPQRRNPADYPREWFLKKYPHLCGHTYEMARDGPQQEEKVAKLFKVDYKSAIFGNTLHRALGGGRFEEVSDRAGIETWWPWGVVTGDFDNDVFEDVFIPAGMGFPFSYWPNSLMMNNGDGTFTDRAAAAGMVLPPDERHLPRSIAGMKASRSSRAAAVADFRRVGRLDIVVNNFNDNASLYRNEYPQKNYVQFRLTGAMRKGDKDGRAARKSSRDAVGALVYLHIGKEVMVRQMQTAGGYLSQSSRVLHFGLDDRKAVDKAVIVWPSGRREEIPSPAINTLHDRDEPTLSEP